MKQFSKELGKVSITPKGDWNSSIANEKLDIVYDRRNNQAYIAKQDVPIGVDIDNREYWQPLNVSGYADNNFINLTAENENGTITAYESLEEAVATIFPINRRVGATLSFYNLNSDRLDRQAEFELWQFNSTDLANWENKDYWNNIYYNWNVFAGWYVDANTLNNHVKIPNVGQYAYVGSNLNDAILYQCRTNGTWTNTGIKVRNYISVVVSGNITIGENGNWFSDGKDTGIPATPAVDEQLDNIIMQLQQHTTEINGIKEYNENLQDQITSNDNDITNLTAKHESLSRTVQGIAATGGASTATNVTYDNNTSGLNAENAQDAIDELENKKFDKESVAQKSGDSEELVMSQKSVSDKLRNLSLINNAISCSGLIAIGDAITDNWEKHKVLDYFGNVVNEQNYETSPYIEHSGAYNKDEFVSFKSSYSTSYNNVSFYKNNTFSFSINVPAKEGVIVSFLLPKGYSCRISTRIGLGDWYIKSINAERLDNFLHRPVNNVITDIYNTVYGKSVSIIKGGWLTKMNKLEPHDYSYYTDYIKVKQGDVFSITANTEYGQPCVYIILDEDKKVLDYLSTSGQYNNYELVISSDKAYWVRFSSYQSPLLVEYKSNIKSASGITLNKGTYPFFDEIDAIKGGWLTNEDKVSAQESSYYTDYIKVKKGDTFFVKANTEYGNPCIYIIFDENKNVLSFLNKEGKYAWLKVKITDEKATYIRFSSFNSMLVVDKETTSKYPNALFGKKYAFCGDSFTESILSELTDENGLSGKNSPEYWDKHKNMWKSYAWHICSRNNMLSYADGLSGSRMTIVYNDDGSIKTANSFSNERYKKIPLDTDYCTLMFGLNEINVPLGTKDSTDKSTLWGAWNVVLEYLITNHPYMKIGIIIPDAWETKEQSAELKKIAQWWGIPYLDLKDENISVNIGGRYEGLNPKVATLRNKAFQISDSNAHPNAKAQLYRSYAIEEFIRKL